MNAGLSRETYRSRKHALLSRAPRKLFYGTAVRYSESVLRSRCNPGAFSLLAVTSVTPCEGKRG
jgi:hypothetical protein